MGRRVDGGPALRQDRSMVVELLVKDVAMSKPRPCRSARLRPIRHRQTCQPCPSVHRLFHEAGSSRPLKRRCGPEEQVDLSDAHNGYERM
jgi:hypothetical protein